MSFHKSVLLQQTIKNLNIQAGKWYLDATLGGGGHTQAILKAGAKVLALDQDQEAIDFASQRLQKYLDSKALKIVKSNFAEIAEIIKNAKLDFAGVLFDLGVSSHQFDDYTRGFSFNSTEKLDMRMNAQADLSAYEVVNEYPLRDLAKIILKYGEDPLAIEIATAIVETRKSQPIVSGTELAELVKNVYQKRYFHSSKYHPATRTFQAIRMFVNDELASLRTALSSLPAVLSSARIAVISFHGLEDRLVKQNFINWRDQGLGKIITAKPISPDRLEIKENARSRSAKLRVFSLEK